MPTKREPQPTEDTPEVKTEEGGMGGEYPERDHVPSGGMGGEYPEGRGVRRGRSGPKGRR
jgi:hypothetical protein